MPTDPDPHPRFPFRDFRADRVQEAHHLVSRDPRKLQARKEPGDREHAARLHFDPHLPRSGLRSVALHEPQRTLGFLNLHSFHERHGQSPPGDPIAGAITAQACRRIDYTKVLAGAREVV